MRSVRRFTQLLLTLAGTGLSLFAVARIETLYDRVLLAVLGLMLMQAGIWQLTTSFMPNQRRYRPLRQETEYFLSLVRRLNAARLTGNGAAEVERLTAEMHHSVGRMVQLAGQTEADLVRDTPYGRRRHRIFHISTAGESGV